MKIGLSTVCLLGAAILAGCSGQASRNPPLQFPLNDMRYQGKFRTQSETRLFADGRTTRRPVEGTVAIGQLREDDAYFTGVVNNQYIGKNPETVNKEFLEWGQRRYNTYCSPCHDRTGQGRGVVGQRAIWIASNLLEDRIRNYNDGEIFTVITNGRRSMPPYRFQVTERDRWAIVAYVRALQRAGAGAVEDVPQELRSELR